MINASVGGHGPATAHSSKKAAHHLPSSPSSVTSRTFIELFAGIGLVRLGLEQSGWRCVLANDFSAKKEEMYRLAFKDSTHFIREDIWKLVADEQFTPPAASLVTASFPCIDLSLAGNRAGLAGEHSSAFWAAIEFIKRIPNKPNAILFENVVGFATSRDGLDFAEAAAALTQAGYVVDSFVLDARHFTAQSRPRLFLLGFAPDLASKSMVLQSPNSNPLEWLQVFSSESGLRPKALMKAIRGATESHWGFLRLPLSLPDSPNRLSDIIEATPAKSPLWWSQGKVKKLISQMSTLHLSALEKMKMSPVPTYGTVYRRTRVGRPMAELRTDGIAGCLRTPRGGSSQQIVVEACQDSVKVRWMTPRETARLQGVPDSFPLPENRIQALFGFGDAVCVPVLEWIGKKILNPAFDASSASGSIRLRILDRGIYE